MKIANNLSKRKIVQFQKEILGWYAVNRRELPWREVPAGTPQREISNGISLGQKAYMILVSEIMSQQTQISRVIPKFELWMRAFPTVEDLAKASTSDVLTYWSGLGYNRRALYLHKCAKVLCHPELDSGSAWDSIASLQNDTKAMLAALQKLPGIEEYTAAAVACFAFDAQVAVVDTNVRKVIILLCSGRLQKLNMNHESGIKNQEKEQKKNHNSYFMILDSIPQNSELTNQEIEKIATALLPVGRAAEWNQALMDYASSMLKKEKIVIPKQSKFKGSNRFYRGQIIKLLIAQKQIEIGELAKLLKITQEKCSEIIKGLEKDGLVSMQNGTSSIV